MDALAHNQTLEERIYNISGLNFGIALNQFYLQGVPKKWDKSKNKNSNFPVNNITAAEKIKKMQRPLF